jgi:signal transduction histidine kinase
MTARLVAGALGILLLTPPAAGQTHALHRVLVLHPDLALLPGAVLADHGFRSRLGAAGINAEFVTQHIDQASSPDAGVVELLRRNIATRRFDVVYAIGISSLRFAIANRTALFPDVPIVFSIITDNGLKGIALDPDVSGVITSPDPVTTLKAALGLQPDVRRVVVVGGTSTLDRIYLDDVRHELEAHPIGLTVSYLAGLPLDATRSHLAALPSDTIVLFVSMLQDGAGRAMTAPEALTLLRPEAAVPIYGLSDTLIGQGIVGGYLVSFEAEGSRAAEIALTRAATPPHGAGTLERGKPIFAFDALELQRWGLRTRDLPAASTIVNVPPPLWHTYRWQIVVSTSLIALQGGLIAALLVHRARRRQAEHAVLRREAALQITHGQLRDLTNRVITAQEAERSRIARELHDDFGQRIASLSIGLSNAQWEAQTGSPVSIVEHLSKLQAQTAVLAKELRELSHELHPGVLEHVGFVETLRAHCDELNIASGLRVSLDVNETWPDLREETALCLYRVAQEALRNVLTHAHASVACVSITRENGGIRMQITDDGRGFDTDPAVQPGLGLMSMRERVQMLGGRFDLRSSPGAGTIVEATFPLDERA